MPISPVFLPSANFESRTRLALIKLITSERFAPPCSSRACRALELLVWSSSLSCLLLIRKIKTQIVSFDKQKLAPSFSVVPCFFLVTLLQVFVTLKSLRQHQTLVSRFLFCWPWAQWDDDDDLPWIKISRRTNSHASFSTSFDASRCSAKNLSIRTYRDQQKKKKLKFSFCFRICFDVPKLMKLQQQLRGWTRRKTVSLMKCALTMTDIQL